MNDTRVFESIDTDTVLASQMQTKNGRANDGMGTLSGGSVYTHTRCFMKEGIWKSLKAESIEQDLCTGHRYAELKGLR